MEYEKKIKNGSAIEQNRVIKEIYTFNNKELRKTPENLIMNLMKKKEDKQLKHIEKQGGLYYTVYTKISARVCDS